MHTIASRLILVAVALANARAGAEIRYRAVVLDAPSQAAVADGIGNVRIGVSAFDSSYHRPYFAAAWNGDANTFVSLHPSDYFGSTAVATDGAEHVGFGQLIDNHDSYRALLWKDLNDAPISLNPSNFTASQALDVDGGWQVGFGRDSLPVYKQHALLWHGSAESVVDINPPGFSTSSANGISGNYIVGEGQAPFYGAMPVIWDRSTGLAAIVTTPRSQFPDADNFFVSAYNQNVLSQGVANAVSGESIVGYQPTKLVTTGVYPNLQFVDILDNAVLWTVANDGAVNLHPIGFATSQAYGVAGQFQVGTGSGPATGGNRHALVWRGSAGSVFDLHTSLINAGFNFDRSDAHGVDADGNVYGSAFGPNGFVPIVWLAVPEPPSMLLSITCIAALGFVSVAADRRTKL